jgi:ribosomal protein S8E
MTKLGTTRIHDVRTRGGNVKHRALRLDTGNFSWGSEGKKQYMDMNGLFEEWIIFVDVD